MDPISASCYSLHIEDNTRGNDKNHPEDQFSEVIVSCKSLSGYESQNFKSLIPQIIATAISASGHIVVGISLAFSAILIPQLEDANSDLHVTESESSWIASIIVIVVPIGAIAGGFIMDSIGRLNTIKLSTVPVCVGWVLIAMAENVTMLLVGRILTGFAAAWGTSPAIVYITEIARADMRGSLISCGPTYASLGMVLLFLKGWFLNWRTVAWLCNIYTVVPAILIMFIPESPVWLVSKGRVDQAKKAIEWLNKYQPALAGEKQTFSEMQLEYLVREKRQKDAENVGGGSAARKFKAFFQPTGYKPMLVLIGLFFFQQFSGIYITLFYSVNFFLDMGSTINAYFSSVLIGVVRFLMSMVNTYLLKRYHRRPLTMISCAGIALCMGVSGLFTYWINNGESTQTWVPVVLLLMYVLTSMIGLLPIPWTMTAELFPLEIRGIAHSISYSLANILMFFSLQMYRPLKSIMGGSHGIQWFFAGVAIVGMLYIFVFLPETHGKKLSQIQEYFKYNTMYLAEKKAPTKRKITRKDKSVEPKQGKILIEA
ncbi:PREDICTED: facilitated trehalose transporter Tret1-like [Nicrophorus vespilloides]|uniref:Facilitated trehalose transporter Tret1-like n=1 Tax=Nicrophorus vespilloides TaxID=110193 RepID=A0ABM1N5K6_NICVS|nr:PREDICTED: facilitated trehalose transporter Tret1-like [Nicrophorus vespilloides]